MPTSSAGLLLFRRTPSGIRVLIGHMGGPYWARKDDRAWSIPKGMHEVNETAQDAAVREFTEELGSPPPPGDLLDLGAVRQRSGKVVRAWAIEGEFDVTIATSNAFETEWPPRSGQMQSFPEIDRVEWVDIATARTKLVAAQTEFLDRLMELVTPAAGLS